jgi:hypothetical protein
LLSSLSTESLARSSAAHPKLTILIWVGVLVIGFVLIFTLLGSATTVEGTFTNNPDSKIAQELIEDRIHPTHAEETAVITSNILMVDDASFKSVVEEFTTRARALGPEFLLSTDGNPQILNFYESGIETLVSESRRTTLVPFTMAGDL